MADMRFLVYFQSMAENNIATRSTYVCKETHLKLGVTKTSKISCFKNFIEVFDAYSRVLVISSLNLIEKQSKTSELSDQRRDSK